VTGLTEYTAKAVKESERIALATVAAKHADGLSLIFDGQTDATTKHYKCNTAVNFAAGSRVVCLRISGSWIVAFAFGNPA
jgi:hypothetical protein